MSTAFSLDVGILREVLDRLNIGVYVTDRERRILLWNRKAEEITGHKAADVIATACWDGILQHVDKDGHPLCSTHLCPLYRAMHIGKESKDPIVIYARKADGRRVAVSVSVAPLFGPDGQVIGGIETFRDETENIADLEFAGRIQKGLLPRRMPQAPGLVFDARSYQKDLVGGDFYDVRDIGDGRFFFLLADVRGHGVSAAFYTMWLKSLEESLSSRLGDPPLFLSALNAELERFMISESFATAVCGVLDTSAYEVTYSNAGHPRMLHRSGASGRAAPLESHGLPLGISADEEYTSSRVTLEPGDALLAYTDGVTDAEMAGGALGEKGLAALLESEAAKGHARLAERLYFNVLNTAGQVALADDATLLVICRTA